MSLSPDIDPVLGDPRRRLRGLGQRVDPLQRAFVQLAQGLCEVLRSAGREIERDGPRHALAVGGALDALRSNHVLGSEGRVGGIVLIGAGALVVRGSRKKL